MNKLKQLWSNLRGSFWFLPSLIVAGSIAVALSLIQADTAGGQQWMSRWPRLFGASAAGTRGVLSTIAGSMMLEAFVSQEDDHPACGQLQRRRP